MPDDIAREDVHYIAQAVCGWIRLPHKLTKDDARNTLSLSGVAIGERDASGSVILMKDTTSATVLWMWPKSNAIAFEARSQVQASQLDPRDDGSNRYRFAI
ncbi:hypothetical protein GLOTRDRAFT_111210 [Gloeophyllum trabeum ATCC 11539]|uniref:Uncharacterized protein n=1 Tax=Gloeophyllum trabeum (strain ATCC 11539 / FP-39264 / Madison 617) TaxID=670483 RepID=S7RLQ8_GLOTA|nr:uncharacterized protein GLOTRDRAFT_111210 [Gloeophyllum trabeum ATCC 11539]EPQ55340.1 hypothetical protein GLOTRDRAFT_111210 [Gloeophyllum trabeum ATCC 11539]